MACQWKNSSAEMISYHDKEWGVPTHDDQKLFEYLLLESMQAGLSWALILRKR
ncbi:MAG: DNA-3-methyladenine glycosylase I, partial [Oribacterium parvum]|nr:DNA-3-methyladenine glycosylase I [Oribacterium parvum]